jgi:transcriptional regulator with XRE-family HTH domain
VQQLHQEGVELIKENPRKDMESMKHWILSCDTSRYDIHTLFKKDGFCLWNQRRNFEVGDVVYIYESKPVSKIVYKAVVEEINIRRDKPENTDNFYKKDYNKEFAFKLKYEATNPGNRLQFVELQEKFGISGMSLINIPEITDKEMIDFFEDVFAGKVEDLPAPPTKEELYKPLESGTIQEHIQHKMDYCEIRDSHLAKLTGISNSSIGRVRKGESIKSDCMLTILDELGFGFVDSADESRVYGASEITEAIKQRIISSDIRTTELASLCDASPSVISHLKNDGKAPKFEVLEKLINYYGFKVILK